MSRTKSLFAGLSLGILLAGLLTSAAEAQRRPNRSRISAGAGLAVGVGGLVGTGLGFLGQLTVQKSVHQATLRGLALYDIGGFPDSGGSDVIAEADLLYGRTHSTSWGHASISAGVSLLQFDACPANAADACWTAGLPIVAEAALSARVIGLGVQTFANLNSRAIHGGLALVLFLGWLP